MTATPLTRMLGGHERRVEYSYQLELKHSANQFDPPCDQLGTTWVVTAFVADGLAFEPTWGVCAACGLEPEIVSDRWNVRAAAWSDYLAMRAQRGLDRD